MSTLAITVLVVALWFFAGWIGARLHLKEWHDTFGDYEDAIGMAVFMTVVGPCGFIAGVMIRAANRPKRPASHHAKFWGLS